MFAVLQDHTENYEVSLIRVYRLDATLDNSIITQVNNLKTIQGAITAIAIV